MKASLIFEKLQRTLADASIGENFGVEFSYSIPKRDREIIFFQDASGERGILIPLELEETTDFQADTRSQYISMRPRRRDGAWHAELTLSNDRLASVFYSFLDVFISSCSASTASPVQIAAAQLRKWRSLFAKAPNIQMSMAEEIGLICELEVLVQLLESEGMEAFLRWTGPRKQRHDFRLVDRSIECKATTSKQGLPVTIHQIDQLNPESPLPLVLVVHQYEVTPNGPLNLFTLIHEVAQDPRIPTEEFLLLMAKNGVHVIEDRDFQRSYRRTNRFVFDVVEGFPRLDVGELSKRISNISYKLELSPPESVPGYRKDTTNY